MVWQETGDVAVIVMLTKTLEQGQNKCFQYFPLKVEDAPWTIDGDEEYGDGFHATLTLLEKTKEVAAGSTLRKMSMVVNGKEKIVWHLLFKGWPDFGVPAAENKDALLEMIKLANLKNTGGPQNPLIVCHLPCTISLIHAYHVDRCTAQLVLAVRVPILLLIIC